VVVGGMLIGPVMLFIVVPALRMMFLGSEGDRQPASPAAAPDSTLAGQRRTRLPIHEEACMKVVFCLFALLACSAMSTNVAAADKPKTAVTGGTKAVIATPNTKTVKTTAPSTTTPRPAAASTANQAANSAAVAVVAKNGSSVSGIGMTKPGTGTGSVGGAAKITGGAISGNSFQPKHH
jgi:hypothetical protein